MKNQKKGKIIQVKDRKTLEQIIGGSFYVERGDILSLENKDYFSPFYDEKTRRVLVIKVGKEIKTLSISEGVILIHTFRGINPDKIVEWSCRPLYRGLDEEYDTMLKLLKEKRVYLDPTEAIYGIPIEDIK